MAKHDELLIEPRDGQWIVKKPHAERVSTIEDYYKDALAYAKQHAPEGDIKVKGLNGEFRHVQKSTK